MRKLLVSYITIGYPDKEGFIDFIKEADALGTDFFELGYPPNFAKYDGPLIRKSYNKVKLAYTNFYDLIKEARKATDKDIIVLTYLDSVKENLNSFLKYLRESGADGVLFPDLLIDFTDNYLDYVNKASEYGLYSVIFVNPFLPDKIISEASKVSNPFLYYGVRPTTGIATPVSLASLLNRLKSLTSNKVVVGFGLKNLNDIREAVSSGADGVAIGSLYVEAFENGGLERALEVVKKVREALDRIQ